MKTNTNFKWTLVAAAVALAFPATGAWAGDEVAELISPNAAEVTLKAMNVDGVNPLHRYYNGLNHQGVNGSIDLNFVQRSEEGRWIRFDARDLGLRTQELNASIEQQGDWAVKLGYDQIPRYAAFQVNSPVQGIGTNSITLPSTPFGVGSNFSIYDLKTERTATSIKASKFVSDGLQLNFGFKNEDKKGARMAGASGNSFASADPLGGTVRNYSAQFFTPEPIDSRHQQFEASLDYYSKKFQLSGGYYGSFYQHNVSNALFVTPTSIFGKVGEVSTGATLPTLSTNLSPLSLTAPDNHAQQLYLTGGYNWSDDTRGTFKVAKAVAEQNESFIPGSLITPGVSALCGITLICPSTVTSRSNLGGKVETTNAFVSVTSRLTRELSVLASWTYEDRNDKTPRDVYAIDYGHGGSAILNNPESQTVNRGKLEATYRLPAGYRVTAGYDYDERHYKGMAEEGFRDKLKEDTVRLDLRKSLSETINGSVQIAHSERTGSSWGSTPDAYGDHWVAPIQFSDRSRDKIKLLFDWMPIDPLNIQFAYEMTRDDYDSRMNGMGLDKGKTELYSLDASYRISENWRTNLWYSLGFNKIKQNERQNPRLVDPVTAENIQNCNGTALNRTCSLWTANLDLKSEALGAGVQGKFGKLDVGAQYRYSRDVNEYNVTVGPLVGAGTAANSPVLAGAGVLPNTLYSMNVFQLFGRYPVAKNTSVRVDYVYDLRKLNDYAWSNWRYSDGTTVLQKPEQTTQLLGLSLILGF